MAGVPVVYTFNSQTQSGMFSLGSIYLGKGTELYKQTSTQNFFWELFLSIAIRMNRHGFLGAHSYAVGMGMCPDPTFDPDCLASCSSLNDEGFKESKQFSNEDNPFQSGRNANIQGYCSNDCKAQ